MAARQGPNIFSMRGRKNRRERKKEAKETWFKLQQFCISHQENGIRFHRSDLMWYSSCRNCISYQDKWEITGKHLERDIRIGLISAWLRMCCMLCHGVQSGSRNHYDDHPIPKVKAEIQVLLTGMEPQLLHTHARTCTHKHRGSPLPQHILTISTTLPSATQEFNSSWLAHLQSTKEKQKNNKHTERFRQAEALYALLSRLSSCFLDEISASSLNSDSVSFCLGKELDKEAVIYC